MVCCAGEKMTGDQDREITIQQGGVASLGGIRVGIGNMWERDYPLPDGSTRRGLSVMLFVMNGESLIAGEGSVISVAGLKWRIVTLKQGNPLGCVRFFRMD
jgi:hypothetical protein